MPISREIARRVDLLKLPDRYVCIHTASENFLRDWQPTHWNRLIDHINGVHGLSVVELGLRSPRPVTMMLTTATCAAQRASLNRPGSSADLRSSSTSTAGRPTWLMQSRLLE